MGGAQFSYSPHFLHTVAGRVWCMDLTLYPDGQILCNPCLNFKTKRVIRLKLTEISSTLVTLVINYQLQLLICDPFSPGEGSQKSYVQCHVLHVRIFTIKCQ